MNPTQFREELDKTLFECFGAVTSELDSVGRHTNDLGIDTTALRNLSRDVLEYINHRLLVVEGELQVLVSHRDTVLVVEGERFHVSTSRERHGPQATVYRGTEAHQEFVRRVRQQVESLRELTQSVSGTSQC